MDASLAAAQSHLRSLTVRPFLPRYFPGYGIYWWLDADTWVQESYALDLYLAAAEQGSLAITPELDRAYRIRQEIWTWRFDRLKRYHGAEAAEALFSNNYCNAGVFALRADAPHWARWAHWFRQGLAATDGKLVCDQTALNQAIRADQLKVNPLPAVCNWLCHCALPAYDRAAEGFYEPYFPHARIGILHLTGDSKNQSVQWSDARGGVFSTSLRAPAAAD